MLKKAGKPVKEGLMAAKGRVNGRGALFLPLIKTSYQQGYKQLFNRENIGNVDKSEILCLTAKQTSKWF